jgi:hypothetical protein
VALSGCQREPGSRRYVWSLRVFAIEGAPGQLTERLAREHYYRDMPVRLAAGQFAASPTFAEQFNLRPGQYRVEVALHPIPADFNLVDGAGPAAAPRGAVTRYRRITIAD